jgi:TonB-dependent receptor
MNTQFNKITRVLKSAPSKATLCSTAMLAILAAPTVSAQEVDEVEVIEVSGIRSSLTSALLEKRDATNLIEVIKADDIGKLPDQNLAEVLENITGIQITREAGVGTGVQIRGTDDNRIQINGVSTVGSGTGRGGMSFEDIDASIIAEVQVIKSPEAKTTEGSVGGTINLKTIRPLSLTDTIGSVRVQAETSSLSDESPTPRLSGTFGDNWETDAGKFGIVLSGSYTRSDNTDFQPRLDRDVLVTCNDTATDPCAAGKANGSLPADAANFLGVQFLNQVLINQEYETKNFAGSIEFAPNDDVKFYADVVLNSQTRDQESHRSQFSGVGGLNSSSAKSNYTHFTEYDLGTIPGENGDQHIGSMYAVTQGKMFAEQSTTENPDSGIDPNLRSNTDTGARYTDSSIFRLGSEFKLTDELSGSVELSTTKSETVSPNLSLVLNFINPNSSLSSDRDDDNSTPLVFDLRDGIAFGVDFDSPYAPTPQQMLDPANYVMDSGGTYSANESENTEDTLRGDFTYYVDAIDAITSVDFGYRYNKRTSLRDNINASTGGTGSYDNSLNGSFISDILVPMPDNFGDGTGNDLFISGILQLDPELAANPEAMIAKINAGIAESGVSQSPIGTELESDENALFDVEEVSNAFYAQANFEYGIFRGNAGLRYVKTDFEANSTETTFAEADGTAVQTRVKSESSNNYILPRLSIVADINDDLVARASFSEDINRPDFAHMTPALDMPNRGGVNDVARRGNEDLEPEEVSSFDISIEWYFAEASVLSAGYFYKKRSNLFGAIIEQPAYTADGLRHQVDMWGRDRGPTQDGAPCTGGGVMAEGTEAGVFRNTDQANFGSDDSRGVCVGNALRFNADGETTQQGFEFAFQYSLAEFEDSLGWASGFGVIANYTIQDADVNTGFLGIGESRARAIYAAQGFDGVEKPLVSREAASLLNFSEDAYNFTVFYEKYGISARARYTYRSAYQTDQLPGTSNEFDPMGTRAVVNARGQLNANVSYDVNENFVVSIDAVNLTESDSDLSCIEEGGLLCYEGITDRRIIAGASYRF